MEQKSAEWFEARRTRITASVAGALLGLNPYTSAKAARKAWIDEYRGNRREFSSPDMDRGNRLEPGILNAVEEAYGDIVMQDGGREYQGWLWASGDGWMEGGPGETVGVEAKAPRKFFDPAEKLMYLVQIYLQSITYEWDQCLLAQGVEVDGCLEVRTTSYTLDELVALIEPHTGGEPILPALMKLHAEMVNEAEQEPVEEEVFSNEEWEICSTCYAEAKAEMAEAKAKMDIYRDRMLAACDNKAVRGRRFMVIEATRTGSLNAKKLQTEHPDIDLDQYRGKPSTYLTIRETK